MDEKLLALQSQGLWSHACYTAETLGMFAGQPNSPGSPTAQQAGSETVVLVWPDLII